jgi:hypothetical protein
VVQLVPIVPYEIAHSTTHRDTNSYFNIIYSKDTNEKFDSDDNAYILSIWIRVTVEKNTSRCVLSTNLPSDEIPLSAKDIYVVVVGQVIEFEIV